MNMLQYSTLQSAEHSDSGDLLTHTISFSNRGQPPPHFQRSDQRSPAFFFWKWIEMFCGHDCTYFRLSGVLLRVANWSMLKPLESVSWIIWSSRRWSFASVSIFSRASGLYLTARKTVFRAENSSGSLHRYFSPSHSYCNGLTYSFSTTTLLSSWPLTSVRELSGSSPSLSFLSTFRLRTFRAKSSCSMCLYTTSSKVSLLKMTASWTGQ